MRLMHRIALAVAVALALLAGPTPGYAQELPPEPLWKWTEAEIAQMQRMARDLDQRGKFYYLDSKHWRVRSDVSARFTVEAALYLDLYTDMLLEAAPKTFTPTDKIRPEAIIFIDRADFLRRSRHSETGQMSYRWRSDELTELEFATYIHSPQERDFAFFRRDTLEHEAVHCLLQKAIGAHRVPSWFHEGHAMHFEGWNPRASLEVNGQMVGARLWHQQMFVDQVRQGRLPRLEGVLALRHTGTTWRDGGGTGTVLNYGASHSLMACLLTNPDAAPFYSRIFERASHGRSRLVEPDERAALEACWYEHLRRTIRDQPQETTKP